MEYSGGLQYRGLCWWSLHFYICNGSIGTGWELPAKYKDVSVKASIGRSKTDSFDNVTLSVSVSEAVALFGRYLRFNLVEQSDNNNNSTLNVNDQSPSMQIKRSAFEVLMTSSRMLDWKYKKKKNLPALSDLKKSGLRTNFFFCLA